MQHHLELKKSTLFLFLAAFFFACSSDDNETTPDPIEDPEPNTAVNIPDVNFEKKLLALGVDTDGEINQQIWLEDALAVTELELHSSNEEPKITDLTGIEAFRNLKELSAANNALQSVSLDENQALESLNLDFNQLLSIDLSANTELTVLSLARNELESIDLSANVKLQTLNLEANYLESLNVSSLTELKDLNAIVNLLTSIEGLDQTTKLYSLNLAFNYLETLSLNLPKLVGLNVEHNLLKVLEVEGCTSLEYLLATNNQIQALNLDNNPALKHLKASFNQISNLSFEHNDNLELIWASANELSSLDVSHLSALYELRIVRNDQLSCIQISAGQEIDSVQKEDHQSLSTESCD